MLRTEELYPEHGPNGIMIAFDISDPKEEDLSNAFVDAFGEQFARSEEDASDNRRYLEILPGGALALLRRREQRLLR